MLTTTMPSYRFSISRAPRWGSRRPAISDAAVSTSSTASLGHTDRSQTPGSSRTTATLARRPAVATTTMNHRSRGGRPLKVIPPSCRRRPAGCGPAGRSVRRSSGPRPTGRRPGAGRPAARGPAPGRPVDAGPAPGGPAPRLPGELGPAPGRPGPGRQVRRPPAVLGPAPAAQLRATQSTAPPGPLPGPSRAAASRPPQDHWRAAQPAGWSPAAAQRLAAQIRASHCWAAQLLIDGWSATQRPLSQGWGGPGVGVGGAGGRPGQAGRRRPAEPVGPA
jgi:hypothetical protein